MWVFNKLDIFLYTSGELVKMTKNVEKLPENIKKSLKSKKSQKKHKNAK